LIGNELPKEHAGARFEAPLVAVLTARAKQMGNRVAGLSIKDCTGSNFGYFKWSKTTPGEIKTIADDTLTVPLTAEQVMTMPDLRLTGNYGFSARLESPSTGYSQNLHMLVQLQKKKTFPDPSVMFEIPKGADMHREAAEIAASSGSKEKQKVAPKAKAKAVKMPKVLRQTKQCVPGGRVSGA
jgi:hypothetical protein